MNKQLNLFEIKKYTPGLVIDPSTTFDTVDHSNLLEKLELYGITNKNHNGSKTTSEIGDNSFKSVRKKNQAYMRTVEVFQKSQLYDRSYFFYM